VSAPLTVQAGGRARAPHIVTASVSTQTGVWFLRACVPGPCVECKRTTGELAWTQPHLEGRVACDATCAGLAR
jgi:predicted metal-binding protein